MTEDATDRELLTRIALQEAEALEQLYDRYERTLYGFAYRIVREPMAAEEVVQELFLRIWKAAERYDAQKGKPIAWMLAIARRIAIDRLRRQKSRLPAADTAEDSLAAVADERQDTARETELRWLGDRIRAALTGLNQDQQDVVELIYYQGYTQQEVCEMRDIPLGTVKSRVRLALKQLRAKLADLGKEGMPV